MLRYFQSAYFTRTLLLVLLAALLWLPAFLLQAEPPQVSGSSGPLYQLFLFLIGSNIFIQLLITFLITIATAFLLNQLATTFGFSARISQLAMLMYILLSSALSTFTVLSPLVVVNFLLLFVLRSLFKLSETNKHIPLIFNAALITGITALIYLPAAFMLLIIWLSFIIFRIVKWRFFLVSIVGFTIPILYTFTWYFWFDQSKEAYNLFTSLWVIHLPDILSYSIFDLILGGILLVYIFIVVIRTINSLMERNINIRQILAVTLNYLVLTFLLFVLYSSSQVASLMMSIPAALIMASALTGVKKTKWYEWSLRLILLLFIANHYISLLNAA